MFSHYRRFIKNFAGKARCLYRLHKNDVRFEWTEECNDAYEDLKDALINEPILAQPNFADDAPPFIVTVDASARALGAVLEQKGIDGKMHVIEYYSAKFDERKSWGETKWIYMKELHSLGRACTRWRYYLYMRDFIVRTDNSFVKSVLEKSNHLTGERAKVWAKLDGFVFTVEHIPGDRNFVADALSREVDSTNIVTMYSSKPIFHKLIDEAHEKKRTLPFIVDRYRNNLIQDTHILLGDVGARAIFLFLKDRCYWTNMQRNIEEVISKCMLCAKNNYSNNKYKDVQRTNDYKTHTIWGADIGYLKNKQYP